MKIKSKSNWKYAESAQPEKGFHDYERIVEFEEPISKQEEEEFFASMKENDNPGWCYFRVTKISDTKFLVETSNDSS